MFKFRIKRTIIVMLAALVIVFMSATFVSSFGESKVPKPVLTAGGAIVYCENTGEVVYSQNVDQKYSPYSITKLMTALITVQKLPLDKVVTVSPKAASIGYSSMGLKAGEKVTVEQLLYGALMKSGNDAAYALGEAVSGNMGDFVILMNKTAKNIGCTHTHFVNPNGVKNSAHYTTASDFLQITRVALSNNIIMKISGTKVYNMPATNKSKKRTFISHLDLLTTPGSGIYAGKTGSWSNTDCSIACAYKKNGLQLYIVLLADTSKQRKKDLKKLIDYSVKTVKGVRVVTEGKDVGKVRIKNGAKTRLDVYTEEAGYAYLPKEGSKSLISTKTVMNDAVTAPVKKGTVAGYYKIYVGDDLVNQVPLVIHENVEKGWLPSYFGISNFMTIIMGMILAIIFGLLIWMTAIKASYKHKKRKIRQRKIMEMAEEEAKREAEHNRRDWHF